MIFFVYVYDAPFMINKRVQREAVVCIAEDVSPLTKIKFDRKRAKEFGANEAAARLLSRRHRRCRNLK